MAIKFGAHHKREKTLFLVIIVALAMGGVVISFFIGQQNIVPLVLKPVKPLEPNINWNILSDARLDKLQPLQDIPALEGKPGRDNPFIIIGTGESQKTPEGELE